MPVEFKYYPDSQPIVLPNPLGTGNIDLLDLLRAGTRMNLSFSTPFSDFMVPNAREWYSVSGVVWEKNLESYMQFAGYSSTALLMAGILREIKKNHVPFLFDHLSTFETDSSHFPTSITLRLNMPRQIAPNTWRIEGVFLHFVKAVTSDAWSLDPRDREPLASLKSRLAFFHKQSDAKPISSISLSDLRSSSNSAITKWCVFYMALKYGVAVGRNNVFTIQEISDGSPLSSVPLENLFDTLQENGDNNVQVTCSFSSYPVKIQYTGFSRARLYSLQGYSYDFFAASGGQRVITSPKEADMPVYGVELELSTDYSVRELIDAVPSVWLCAKSDSSITGSKNNRYEMVTLPMSFKAHKMLWTRWFEKLNMKKFDTTRDTNNGMHVHISRESFDNDRHKRDFAWVFTTPAMQRFMIDISERGTLNNYCSMPNIKTSLTNKVAARRDALSFVSGIRGVVNTSKRATIEVRLFKGIVNLTSVIKNLELVDAVFHFTQDVISYQSNPLEGFMAWLDKTPKNQYTTLKRYISSVMKIEEHLDISRVTHIAHGAGYPDLAFERMVKKNLKLSHASVAGVLNSIFNTSRFSWSGGVLHLSHATNGTLSLNAA